eukprot:PhF_6_TR11721/c0_g1_i1/m.19116
MTLVFFILFLYGSGCCFALSPLQDYILPSYNPQPTTVTPSPNPSPTSNITVLRMTNGIVSRDFAFGGTCFTTVDYRLIPSHTVFFRALSPEAIITLNGSTSNVGSCLGQAAGHYEFFNLQQTTLVGDPTAWGFVSFSVSNPTAPFPWTPGIRHTDPTIPWPPKGKQLTVRFAPPLSKRNHEELHGIRLRCGRRQFRNGCGSNQTKLTKENAMRGCANMGDACFGISCSHSSSSSSACTIVGHDYVVEADPTYSTLLMKSDLLLPSSITVSVHYEMYDGLPFMRKWVSVSVAAGGPSVVVNALTIENLRAPNFGPDQMTILQVQPNNPTPATQQVVPQNDQSFPGRTQQLWYFDPMYDQGNDQELHVPYTYYTYLQVGYGVDTTFGGSTGPGVLVTATAPFDSISIRTVLHDTTDWERQGLAIRLVQATLAPQLTETPLHYMITDISSTAAFRLAIDQAAQTGFEIVIVGYGAAGYCGMCDDQIMNASWVSWFGQQVAYAKGKNVGVSAYTLMQHNGWGESVPPQEQVLNRDGTRGGIACFATDWHATYRQHVLNFAKTVGLSGVETDGQYENAACGDAGGDHHHNGLDGSYDAQLKATLTFNQAMKGLGIYQTGADAYYWDGANNWNHADTDAGYSLPDLWERLTVGREYVYDSTTTRLASSGSYGIGDISNAAKQCGNDRVLCMDYALASFFAVGVNPTIVASSLWPPADPMSATLSSLLSSWTTFYAKYRTVLTSRISLHIARPTSRSYEVSAMLWKGQGIIAVFNPTATQQQDTVYVPLYYGSFGYGAQVMISAAGSSNLLNPVFLRNATVGKDGGGLYDVMIPINVSSRAYTLFFISQA